MEPSATLKDENVEKCEHRVRDNDNFEEDELNEGAGSNTTFFRPFLSGWQRAWSNRRKWFPSPGSGVISPSAEPSASVQDQPKKELGGVSSTSSDQQVDPGSALQVKYRRMSLRRTGVQRVVDAANARLSLGSTRQEDDQRPLSQVHTQVDYTNFLIPGQKDIIHCPFYWGKIDRYEAEALLANKPEGSFLLRDSAQVILYL